MQSYDGHFAVLRMSLLGGPKKKEKKEKEKKKEKKDLKYIYFKYSSVVAFQ